MGLENGEWGLGGSGVETREKSVRSQKPEAGIGDWGMGGQLLLPCPGILDSSSPSGCSYLIISTGTFT